MSVEELKDFVKSILVDQIKGTVGREEEKEAWTEMKDFFEEDFYNQIKSIKIDNKSEEAVLLTPEEQEFNKRIKYLEERKKEESEKTHDMWTD